MKIKLPGFLRRVIKAALSGARDQAEREASEAARRVLAERLRREMEQANPPPPD